MTRSIPLPHPSSSSSSSFLCPTLKNVKIIIVGIPNVGKSTIINRLRAIGTSIGGKAVKTGALPGVTRSLSGLVHISTFGKYKLFLYDTPGILMPKIENEEMAFKIALINGMIDSVINPYQLAEYLLTILNKSIDNSLGYMSKYNLNSPITHLPSLLERIAQKEGTILTRKDDKNHETINLTNTIQIFLKAFRSGKLGKVLIE